MKRSKKSQSSAKQVDAAWKRCVKRRESYPFLPMDPEKLDWDDLKYTAADARSSLTMAIVQEHRGDLSLIMEKLGKIPEVGGA